MAIRVMIVDDSIFQRMIMKNYLIVDKRFEIVAFASNGKEALDKLEKMNIDVISLDIDMPQMGGFETIEKIMKYKPTPIIVFSSLVEDKSSKEAILCKELGVVDFIAKSENVQKQ